MDGAITVYVKLLHDDARMPSKKPNDAAWDLYATEDVFINGGERKTVKTGIAVEIPSDWVGLIWPRSGMSVKQGIDVLAGVIDPGYRGEIMVCLYNTSAPLPLYETPADVGVMIKEGDRIAQIVFQRAPAICLEQVDELEDSDRGDKGFGSSGR